ncbi:MAG: DMT family transporter [Proteobacteria bacterium]|nr:DMT family transporter [Pseudomonadota bacterium]
MASLLALTSSLFYALGMVVARIGLRDMDTFSGGLISMGFSLIGALVLFLFYLPIHEIAAQAIVCFVVAGISGPCIGRLLLYFGINRLGSSIAASLYATQPLFSAIAAVALLGERITPGIGAGTLIIVVGLAIISSEESGGGAEKKWSRRDLIFPIMAGAAYGLSHVFRKIGLNINDEPVLGTVIQAIAAFSFPILFVFLRKKKADGAAWKSTRGWMIFGLAGILSVMGQICLFYALSLGEVVIVSPLSATSQFFVLIMAAVFLRKSEIITWKIVLGSILIAGAAILLGLMP